MSDISVDDALHRLANDAPAPRSELIGLDKAAWRNLAEDIAARYDQPPFPASAMDGYAIAAWPDGGHYLTIIGESRAGHPFDGGLQSGEAVRVFTGAPMPAGSTFILLQEDVEVHEASVRLKQNQPRTTKSHIRLQGSDFRSGDVLLRRGERLDPWRLSLAAAAGAAEVRVAERPRIALVCNGAELSPLHAPLGPGQVFESNSYALHALIIEWGGLPQLCTVDVDDRDALIMALQESPNLAADFIVTVGGASVGVYDVVKPALNALGIQWAFDGVNLKPGRPIAFGRLPDGRGVLCLPGNPAAALVCAQLFLKRLIENALGIDPTNRLSTLPLIIDMPGNGARETYLRARIVLNEAGLARLSPWADQDAAAIQSFAQSQALVRRRPHAIPARAGDLAEYLPLERRSSRPQA